MSIGRTPFSPAVHGFRFDNRFLFIDEEGFRASKLPKSYKDRKLKERNGKKIDGLNPFWYGMGASICMTALDHFLIGASVPQIKRTVYLPREFESYLQTRLEIKDRRRTWQAARQWLTSTSAKRLEVLQGQILPKICSQINQGRPVPIVLIHKDNSDGADFDSDELVFAYEMNPASAALAIAYDLQPDAGRVIIDLYHPDYPSDPGKPSTGISLELRFPATKEQIEMKLSNGKPVYGLIVLDYTLNQPPVVRSLVDDAPNEFLRDLSSRFDAVWADNAVHKKTEDRFGYQTYADVLAKRAAEADTPLTVGIFGAWGSGKTSLMKLIGAALPKDTNISQIWVDAWTLSTQEEVWQAFLQVLFNEVNRKLSPWRRIDVRKLGYWLIATIWRLLLVIIPIIVGVWLWGNAETGWSDILALIFAGSGLAGLLAYVKPIIKAWSQVVKFDVKTVLKYEPYEAQITELAKLRDRFNSLVNVLVGTTGRLVIFVDDLDRCAPDKITGVLEAIKLFATVPACVYVLGLDYEIVQSAICKSYRFRTPAEAGAYLEKMIQIPFHLPPLDRQRIEFYIRDEYPNLHADCPKVGDVFSLGLEANPRQVKRALNVFRTLLELSQKRFMNWEVDLLENELIAKMVVIQSRSQFRELYARVKETPACLIKVEEECSLNGNSEDGDLSTLFQSGEKRFGDADERDRIKQYVYLTSTIEGNVGQAHPGSLEREGLLGGDKSAIVKTAAAILARAKGDPEKTNRIRQAYIQRLENTLFDIINYDYEARKSALEALAQIEQWDKRAADFPDGRQWRVRKLARILSRGLDYEELETINREYYQAILDSLRRLCQSEQKKIREVFDTYYEARNMLRGWICADYEPQTVTVDVSGIEQRIGRYPVTNRQYQVFVRETSHRLPTYWNKDAYAKGKDAFPQSKQDHPVVEVSQRDADEYCTWLWKKTGRFYTLPMPNSDWLPAARGSNRRYPWGDEWNPQKLNSKESGKNDTTPVGYYSPEGDSPCGAADMLGNVWEWANWGAGRLGGAFNESYENLDISKPDKSYEKALHAASHGTDKPNSDKYDFYAKDTGFRVCLTIIR